MGKPGRQNRGRFIRRGKSARPVGRSEWSSIESGWIFAWSVVWRYSASGGWSKITSLPANIYSYTDFSPPAEDLMYFIEVLHPTGCTSDILKASTLNSTRSNRKNKLKESETTGQGAMNITEGISIFPNPSSGVYTLVAEMPGMDELSVEVYDIAGKMLRIAGYENIDGRLETELDLSMFEDGMYRVHLRSGEISENRMLVKER